MCVCVCICRWIDNRRSYSDVKLRSIFQLVLAQRPATQEGLRTSVPPARPAKNAASSPSALMMLEGVQSV